MFGLELSKYEKWDVQGRKRKHVKWDYLARMKHIKWDVEAWFKYIKWDAETSVSNHVKWHGHYRTIPISKVIYSL